MLPGSAEKDLILSAKEESGLRNSSWNSERVPSGPEVLGFL